MIFANQSITQLLDIRKPCILGGDFEKWSSKFVISRDSIVHGQIGRRVVMSRRRRGIRGIIHPGYQTRSNPLAQSLSPEGIKDS